MSRAKRRLEKIIVTDYGKEVKKRLIDMGMSQTDLAKALSKELNLRIDVFYVGNILAGRRHPQNVIKAIEKITGVKEYTVPK